MELCGVATIEGIGGLPRIEARVPQRFARIDVADARDARLVEQELLERAPGARYEAMERVRGELGIESIDTQLAQRRAGLFGFPGMDPAEMALVGEAQHSLAEFKGGVHMHAIRSGIGFFQQFVRARKPNQLAVEAKMHPNQAAIEPQK